MDYINIEDPKLLDKLLENDIVMKLQQKGFLGRTHHISKKSKKIELLLPAGIEYDTPWVHIRQHPVKMCHNLQMVETCFGFIPSICLNCWKVVVRPKTLTDLFKLYNLMVKMTNDDDKVYCKCGVETVREFVPSLYGGYFYQDTKRQGLDRLAQVRGLLKSYIPTATAYLKRYCTEFELKHGDSKGYNQPNAAKHLEKLIYEYIDMESSIADPPQHCVDHVMAFWIRFTYQYGDKDEAMKFNDGKPLYTPPRQYEEED